MIVVWRINRGLCDRTATRTYDGMPLSSIFLSLHSKRRVACIGMGGTEHVQMGQVCDSMREYALLRAES